MATGQRYERLNTGQIWRRFERSTAETVQIFAPVVFYEDFCGDAVPDNRWTLLDTSSAGDTLPDVITDEPNGVCDIKLDATSEAQVSGLSFGDIMPFGTNVDGSEEGLQFECRLKVKVLPTSGTTALWGLSAAHNTTVDSNTHHAWFRLDGSGAIKIETDDTTNDNDDVATGTTAVADDQYRIFRIDLSDLDNVKFYIDGTRVAASTTFDMSNLLVTERFQPYFCILKASGTSVGTLEIDYCRVWGTRV